MIFSHALETWKASNELFCSLFPQTEISLGRKSGWSSRFITFFVMNISSHIKHFVFSVLLEFSLWWFSVLLRIIQFSKDNGGMIWHLWSFNGWNCVILPSTLWIILVVVRENTTGCRKETFWQVIEIEQLCRVKKVVSATTVKRKLYTQNRALRLNNAFRALFVFRLDGEWERKQQVYHFIRACCAMFYKWWIVQSFRFCVGSTSEIPSDDFISKATRKIPFGVAQKPTAINVKALCCRSTFDLTEHETKASFWLNLCTFAC